MRRPLFAFSCFFSLLLSEASFASALSGQKRHREELLSLDADEGCETALETKIEWTADDRRCLRLAVKHIALAETFASYSAAVEPSDPLSDFPPEASRLLRDYLREAEVCLYNDEGRLPTFTPSDDKTAVFLWQRLVYWHASFKPNKIARPIFTGCWQRILLMGPWTIVTGLIEAEAPHQNEPSAELFVRVNQLVEEQGLEVLEALSSSAALWLQNPSSRPGELRRWSEDIATKLQKVAQVVEAPRESPLKKAKYAKSQCQANKFHHSNVKSYQGTYLEVDGTVVPHGFGSIEYEGDSKYFGMIKAHMRHGWGVYTFSSGGRFEGEWQEDKQHGKGTYTWPSGERYEGEWQADKQHGKGTYTWPDGERYEGEWQDSKQHGKGTNTWPDGERYEGEWQDDKRQGTGTYTWSDGHRYEGEWQDDTMHGKAIYSGIFEERFEGTWSTDKKHGMGTLLLNDGSIYSQSYDQGKLKEHRQTRGPRRVKEASRDLGSIVDVLTPEDGWRLGILRGADASEYRVAILGSKEVLTIACEDEPKRIAERDTRSLEKRE